MVTMLVWSRNRAMQLDALLRSAKKHVKGITHIVVLYRADAGFTAGYARCISQHTEATFVIESDFERNIKSIAKNIVTPYVLGNSDDNVFIRDVDLRKIAIPSDVVGYSLRLGKNIAFCQPAKIALKQPLYRKDRSFLEWAWRDSDPRGCLGYPHPVDSTVYKTTYFQSLLDGTTFSNPCAMENAILAKKHSAPSYLRSVQETALVSIAHNAMTEANNANAGGSLEELEKRYVRGERICIDVLDGMKTPAAHIAMEYKYETY